MSSRNVFEFDGNVKEFYERINSARGYCLVEFYAKWSEPSMELFYALPDLAREFPNIQFIRVNIDNNPEVTSENQVKSVPHVNLMRKGNILPTVVTSVVGYDIPLIRQRIGDYIYRKT